MIRPRVPPPVIALIAAVLMWVLHRRIPVVQWIFPPWNRFGAVTAGVGIGIGLAAFTRFRRERTTVDPMNPGKATQLVTDSVFSISRNPMYLGMLLLLIGWALWLGSASVWLIPPVFLAVMTHAQIVPEEQALTVLFGAQYAAYCREVSRWVGRRATPRAGR